MMTALTINIVLAALVLAAGLGALAWSIATQHADAAAWIARSARRRRRNTARTHYPRTHYLRGSAAGYRA